jgi:hypothetical protein
MVEFWNSLVVAGCSCQGLVDHHRFHECSFGLCRQSLVVFAMSLFSSIEKIYIGFTLCCACDGDGVQEVFIMIFVI